MPFNCPAEYLLSSLRVGSLALKFTDETRITPLEHDGFTASHPGIPHPTTARVFKDKLQPLGDDPGWLEAPSTIKSVIHHVSNGWSGYSIRNGSPWISTTGSFEWAVWEIVRRLDVMKRNAVYLTVVSRQEGHSRNYQGVRHITLDAAEAIDEYCDLNCRGGRHGVDHKRAHDFATSSQEMLFYGRIFRKDIVDTTTWDNETPGLPLPEEFLIPAKHRRGGDWIDHLVWDPWNDGFYAAGEEIRVRRETIAASRRPQRVSRRQYARSDITDSDY